MSRVRCVALAFAVALVAVALADAVASAAESAAAATASGPAGADEPPSGEIAYAVSSGSRAWLEVVALDGSGTRRLTPMPARGVRRRDVAPAWSPDGRRVSFLRLADGRTSGVHVVGRRGGMPRRVLALRQGEEPSPPLWSPGGGRLALDRRPGRCTVRQPFRHRLTVVRADGRGSVEFPALPQARRLTQVALLGWSPDSARLLFLAYRLDDLGEPGECRWHRPSSEVWSIRADGSGRRRLAAGDIYSAEWSPDGRHVAFVACRRGFCRLELVGADGTGRRAAGMETSAWGVDWTWISRAELLVTDNTEDENFVQWREVRVLDVDTGAVRPLAAWRQGHCDESPLLGYRRGWAALACLVYGRGVLPARLKLLDTASGREVDRPWPARPRQGTLNGFYVRLAP
jgi:dipeptidyl aminopeptidase/acylaminoacyl peptidase